MKIVFLGTPEWAVPTLERIIAHGHEVVAVFTQPDKPAGRGNRFHPPPVKISALAHNLPVHQPVKIRTPEVRALFESLAPEIAIIVAYGRIIPDWMLAIPQHGFINLHFSLLPAYRGAAPINWAIVNGEQQTGVTTMQVVTELDAGDILLQQATEIGPEETADQLGARLSHVGAELLIQTLNCLDDIPLRPQQSELVSLAPILKREDGHINWAGMSAVEIVRRVYGFQPWPGAYTSLRGTRLLIWRAIAQVDAETDVQAHQPGTIVRADKNGIVVVCNHASQIVISELQLEGRKRLSARDFLNGVHLQVGERLDV